MDTTFFDDALWDDSFITISRGRIEDITRENRTTLLTVSYSEGRHPNRMEQRVQMLVNNRTLVFDEFGNSIPASELTKNMTIDAVLSSAMTRSIPPQTTAYAIRIIRRPVPENVVTGRIIDIDRNSRTFTTITGNRPSSIIRFQVTNNTRILDMQGRPMGFSRLFPGLRVRIRHADFMTASIPPQTTALEIQVVR